MQLNAENSNSKRTYIAVQLPSNLDSRIKSAAISERPKIQKTIDFLELNKYPHTLDYIGYERIKRAANKIRERDPLFHGDLGFKHFTLQEPTNQSIEKMESFEPHSIFGDKTLVDEFGVPTILTTWLVRDGYGLTPNVQTLSIGGYDVYYTDKHLYIINPNLSNEVVAAILDKYQSEAGFNPQNVVIYGYALSWSELQGLKDNLRIIHDGEKNMRINFDIRY